MVWLVVIILTVLTISYKILSNNNITNLHLDSPVLEVTWTLLPILVLITIAIPRIHLLCIQDLVVFKPAYSTKVIRNQWNWQTEQTEQFDHLLDSSKIDELGNYENPVLLPFNKIRRILLTRTDVLHSLGIPRLGVKLDSTPGRLNAITVEPLTLGLLTGSCYELCGRGHRAIPIYFFIS